MIGAIDMVNEFSWLSSLEWVCLVRELCKAFGYCGLLRVFEVWELRYTYELSSIGTLISQLFVFLEIIFKLMFLLQFGDYLLVRARHPGSHNLSQK